MASLLEPYLARNGGPVILAQIENEYQGSQSYVDWCGQLTVDLALDIPWSAHANSYVALISI